MASSTLLGPRLDLIESGALKVLFNMEAKTMAALPGVPTMFARLKTERDRQIVSFINSALEFARPFTAPPGVPPERLAALHVAVPVTGHCTEVRDESLRVRSRFSWRVRIRTHNRPWIAGAETVRCQSIQRLALARALRSRGSSVPAPCFAAR